MNKHVVAFIALGIVHLLAAAALVLVMWKGAWGVNTEALRLEYFGKALLSLIGVDALFGAGILIAGPLRNITFKAGPVEASLNGDDDGPQHT